MFVFEDETGFCTATDEDHNQTLTFTVNVVHGYNNETYTQIVCTDNGQPELSVTTMGTIARVHRVDQWACLSLTHSLTLSLSLLAVRNNEDIDMAQCAV
jgi:hypothetical protein